MIDNDEISILLELLEYNKTRGMITQADYTKSHKKSKHTKGHKKVQKLGQNEVYTVLRVDKVGGYIDLSKVDISPEDAKAIETRYEKGKSIQSLMISLSGKSKLKLEELYDLIVFPMQRNGEHAFDLLHKNIFELDKLIAPLKLDQKLATLLIDVIKTKYTPPPEKIKAIFEIRTYEKYGIWDIKTILTKAQSFSTVDLPLQIMLEATPYYAIQTETSNRPKAIEVIDNCLKFIEESVLKLKEGRFEVKSFNKTNKEEDNEYESLVYMTANEDKRSVLEEDNDESMGNTEEIKFD